MNITIPLTIDLNEILVNSLDDVDLSGLGADSDSEYEVTDVEVIGDCMITVELSVGIERQSGKFAGKDEIEEVITMHLAENVPGMQ